MVALAVTAWAYVSQIPGPYVATIFVVLLAAILSLINGLRLLVQRHRSSRTIQLDVERWLRRYGYSVADSPQPTATFGLRAIDGQNRKVVIMQLANEAFVTIQSVVEFTQEEQQRLDPITGSEDSTLLFDLKIELFRLGVEFSGLEHPLRRIIIQKKLPSDETFTELTFVQQVWLMRLSLEHLADIMRRAVRERQVRERPRGS